MSLRTPLLATLAAASLLLVGCNGTTDSTAYVDVTGVHHLELVPDVFVLHVNYAETTKDLSKARDTVNQRVNQAHTLAVALGIEERNIRAANLNIQPQWEWQPKQKLIGQRVSRDLTFRVQGFERYVTLMEQLTDTQPENMNPGQTEVSNLGEHEAESLTQAVSDARRRAEILAQAAGRKVGKALIIQEQSAAAPIAQRQVMLASAASQEKAYYSPGENRITRQVYVRFALE